jgi:hypothetical protein
MRNLLLATAFCLAAPLGLATAASAEQTVTFLCAAPAGHVCQFAVKTGGSEMTFALPSGERKEVAASHRTLINIASVIQARSRPTAPHRRSATGV